LIIYDLGFSIYDFRFFAGLGGVGKMTGETSSRENPALGEAKPALRDSSFREIPDLKLPPS